MRGLAISPIDGAVYIASSQELRRSATGASGSFATVSHLSGGGVIYSVVISPLEFVNPISLQAIE